MNTFAPQTRSTPVVRGEYSRDGYEIWRGDRLVYWAGNHAHDSSQPALCREDQLPLARIRQFCIRTAREIAAEQGGRFVGVERVTEAGEERHQPIQRKDK
jgi:hypothetical protein